MMGSSISILVHICRKLRSSLVCCEIKLVLGCTELGILVVLSLMIAGIFVNHV